MPVHNEWHVLMVAERFRRLKAPELLADVYAAGSLQQVALECTRC